MKLRDLFRRAPAAPRLRFLGEQDGANERRFKDAVRPLLDADPHVARAYLVRVQLQESAPTVALCLVSDHGDDVALVRRIDGVFKTLAPGGAALDVAFLTAVQEPEVRRVCAPFFQRGA